MVSYQVEGKARQGNAMHGKERKEERVRKRERGSRGGSGGRVNGEGRVYEGDEAKNMQPSMKAGSNKDNELHACVDVRLNAKSC